MEFEVLEYLPDGVVVCADDGAVQYLNAAAERLFGYERAEVLGRPIEMLIPSRFRAPHRDRRAEFSSAPRVRPMGTGLELVGLRKNGDEVPVEISLSQLRVGSAAYSIAAVRDVTERKAFEGRARALARAEEEMRRRDEALTVASHELRAPAGSLHLQVGLLQRAASDVTRELASLRDRRGSAGGELTVLRERAATIERHAGRVAALIEALLDASAMREGAVPLRLEDAELGDLTREAVGSLRDDPH